MLEKIINFKSIESAIRAECSCMLKEFDDSIKKYLSECIRIYSLSSKLHPDIFRNYKGKYAGKKIVLCAAGPTLNQYEPIEDAIHVAVNRAFLFDKVKFDFIFSCDFRAIKHVINELINYDNENCKKFIGYQDGWGVSDTPESFVQKMNAYRYYTDGFRYPNYKFAVDISLEPLGNFSTIAMQALQFILYTNPAKIYLVGCDVSANGHFSNLNQTKEEIEQNKKDLEQIQDMWLKDWKDFKLFRDIYFTDTSIVSVNPIGLKGLFDEDIYTYNSIKEYL